MTDPAVLIVEDDAHLREALFDALADDSVPVLTAESGAKALQILSQKDIGLVVTDLQMEPMDGATLLRKLRTDYPSLPAVLMTAYGTIENAVDIMRDGACDYLVKPFDAQHLKDVVVKYLAAAKNVKQPIAADPKSQALLKMAERVAKTEATVTISGESGSGKEVVAQYIHEMSTRSEQAFVAINCAAIPENMLEAVLFGYEKGAFTGAANAYPGKFEQANDGTLLLDEISEMEITLQAKLLRVIQEMEVERIGGRRTIPLNVRVLATTNRDLKQQVADGKFREDLFYRLNVFPLHIPPLRDRILDIVPLAELFLCKAGKSPTKQLADCAKQKLLVHDWPGNVRELSNLIQRTLILQHGDLIVARDLALGEDLTASGIAYDGTAHDDADLQQGLRTHEFQLILNALGTADGRRAIAAAALGISPRTLRYKLAHMRESGISIPGDRHE